MTFSDKFILLNSECVKAAAWLDGRIAIKFPSGRVRFYAADPQTFQELMAAPSAGEFYNKRLKFKKVPGRANTREERPGVSEVINAD